jgi:predicted O-methyltransferase YrrM
MKIGLEYIKYQWKAKRRHGIHSPFVYDITDKCLKALIDSESKTKLNSLFKTLGKDQTEIEIQDFGAGSKRLSNKRKVSSIFKTSSSKGKYGKLLYQLAKHYSPKRILEFGTSLGVGTSYLKYGYPDAKITTLEACPETRKIALQNFERQNFSDIESILSSFSNYLDTAGTEKFDLVFVDGHHDGIALMEYMNRLKAITHNDTIFVLDDIRWSESMFNAWCTLVADPQYHVTLDFFRFGIVTPRSQQEKEHFTLKL